MPRSTTPRSLNVAAFLATAAFATVAEAKCSGGGAIKGNFGVLIEGPLTGSNAAEVFNGTLTADGKCSLTGSLVGGVFGQGTVTQSVTGTYTVSASKQGTIDLVLPGSSTAVTFNIGLIKDGKFAEVTGIAASGPAVATLDMTAIASKTYNLSSLSGTYVATCLGSSNSGSGDFGTELAYVTYDGAGNLTATAVGNNDGTGFAVSPTGTYQVSATGTLTQSYASPEFMPYTVIGQIVSNGAELRSVLLQSGSDAGAYRGCMSKKQG